MFYICTCIYYWKPLKKKNTCSNTSNYSIFTSKPVKILFTLVWLFNLVCPLKNDSTPLFYFLWFNIFQLKVWQRWIFLKVHAWEKVKIHSVFLYSSNSQTFRNFYKDFTFILSKYIFMVIPCTWPDNTVIQAGPTLLNTFTPTFSKPSHLPPDFWSSRTLVYSTMVRRWLISSMSQRRL